MSAPAPAVDSTWRALLAAAVDVRAHTQCCSDACGWYCRVPTEILDALQTAAASVTCLSCGAPYGQPHYPGCEFT